MYLKSIHPPKKYQYKSIIEWIDSTQITKDTEWGKISLGYYVIKYYRQHFWGNLQKALIAALWGLLKHKGKSII